MTGEVTRKTGARWVINQVISDEKPTKFCQLTNVKPVRGWRRLLGAQVWSKSFCYLMIGRNDNKKYREPEQRGQRERKARHGSEYGKEMTHSSA